MKYVQAVFAAILAILIISGARSQQSVAPYELKVVADKSGGSYGRSSTTYSLIQHLRGGDVELWKIRDSNTYVRHWISPNGLVWVLTEPNYSGNAARPFGVFGLWARDPQANLRGDWPFGVLPGMTPLSGKWAQRPIDAIDLARSEAKTLSLSGSEQLILRLKNGEESHVTLAHTENMGWMRLIHLFHAQDPKTDALESLIGNPEGESPTVEFPFGQGVPLVLWSKGRGPSDQVLLQTLTNQNETTEGTYLVRDYLRLAVKPSYAARTPGGHYLWFQFSQFTSHPAATLTVTDFFGKTVREIDLLKLGRFANPKAAQESLQYRSLSVERGDYSVPIETAQWTGAAEPERLLMSDSSGRRYVIDVKPNGTTFSLDASASLNLERVSRKEPDYPGSKLEGEKTYVSDKGLFKARVKTYSKDKTFQSQVTLLAEVVDPVEGAKEVEVSSNSIPGSPSSVRVSDSGRIYALISGTWPANGKMPARSYTMIVGWEPAGGQIGGIDPVQLKWFSSPSEAKAGLDLQKMKIDFEGIVAQKEIDGVPVPEWPLESLTFPLNNGRVEKLFVRRLYEHMPSIIYVKHPQLNTGKN